MCEAFAREEWCEREEGTCPELHVWECGEWRARGTCSRGGRCGLRHVLRAETGKSSITEAEAKRMDGDQGMEGRRVPVEGGFEDGAEFIEFGQGSAGAVSSEAEDGDGSEEGPTGEESDGSEDSNAGENEETEDEESVDPAVFKAEAKEPDHGEQRVSPSPFSRAATSPHSDIPMDTDEADEDEVLGVVF